MRAHDDEVTLVDIVEVTPGPLPPSPPPPGLLRPHVEPVRQPDATGALVCIRLNCRQQGLATDDARCLECGHRTQPAGLNRWPRHLTY